MAQNSLITIAALAAAMVAILYALLSFSLKMRKAKFDEMKSRIELDLLRRSYETRVYHEVERLTATPERSSDVNHLLLEAVRRLDDRKTSMRSVSERENRFLKSVGISRDLDNGFEVQEKSVFVLTPFHPRYEEAYDAIVKVCSQVGLRCSRGDEEFIRGGVLSHVIRQMTSAAIVIANIDGRNPNVFYELGIAHALDKDVILMSSSLESVPFDLRSQRLVLWKSQSDLEAALTRTLTRLLVDT